jgi:hypothetical protein
MNEELINFKYIEDDLLHDDMIQLLDGTGDYAHKTGYGTYITYNTGTRPLRIIQIVKPPRRPHMAQLIQVL